MNVSTRMLLCGTRKVIAGPKPYEGRDTWRVVCATCGAGGSVRHATYDAAATACIRDSGRRCAACGAA